MYINTNLKPFTKFTSSSRRTKDILSKVKDILLWSISQMIMKTVPISTRIIIIISNVTKWSIPLWIWWRINGNCNNNMIRISQWRESHCRTNTKVRRKSRTMRITIWDPSRKVNYLSKVIWDRKIIKKLTRFISSTRIVKPVLMMNVKSPLINTFAYGLI